MNDPRTILKDAGYIAVGLGVVAFQQAQVRRRELEQQLGDAGQQLDRFSAVLDERRKLVEERVASLGGQLEGSLNKVITDVRGRIPEQAVEIIDTAVGAAKDAGGQFLDLVRPAKAA